MSHYKVAILGHSQVPLNFPQIPEVELRIYRKSGAKLKHFDQYPEFQEIFIWSHKHNIIFLGSNDVSTGHNPMSADDIATKLINIAKKLHELGQTVHIVQIEPRHFNIPFVQDFYRSECDKVNRRLKRYIRPVHQRIYRTIHFNSVPFQEAHISDGVHFNSVSVQCIIEKMVNAITYSREAYLLQHS